MTQRATFPNTATNYFPRARTHRNFTQLSTSFAALGLVAFSNLLGYANPLNAMQILWINIIMDGPPAQSLGVEPVDPTVMRLPPRRASEPIISPRLLARCLSSACVMVAGTLWVFTREQADGVVSRRDTTMTFTTFVAFDMCNALACRSADAVVGSARLRLFSNSAFNLSVGCSLLAQLAVIYCAPLQAIFQTEALGARDLVSICALASSVLVLDTLRKTVPGSALLRRVSSGIDAAKQRVDKGDDLMV